MINTSVSLKKRYILLTSARAHTQKLRPISLCNVIYKIISKMLVNRLKEVLPNIISPAQSASIPERLISDNILAVYETIHSMQTKMWSKVRFMGIKLDMSKAYDWVE